MAKHEKSIAPAQWRGRLRDWLRRAAWLGACVLAGCSSLQVDVDVYKGALLDEPEIQHREYAYLAISAKPVIQRMSRETEQLRDACAPPGCNRQSYDEALASLKTIVAMYGGQDDSLKTAQRSSTRQKGIEALTQGLVEAFAMPPGGKRKDAIRDAAAALNEALIFFAQRILYVVNYETLFRNLESGGNDTLRANRSVLQSLANTILVHANDLNRQDGRRRVQDQRASAESAAIERTFRVPPALAYDRIVASVAVADAATTPGPDASAASAAASANKKKLSDLETQLRNEQQGLEQYRQGLAGLVATYHSIGAPVAGEMRKILTDSNAKMSTAESKASEQDRRAVAALYPAQPADDADKTEAGALGPLRAWLDRERTSSVGIERKQRLALVLQYTEAEKARLLANIAQINTKADVLTAIRQRVDQDTALAVSQVSDLMAKVKSLQDDSAKLGKQIAGSVQAANAAAAAAAKTQEAVSTASRVRAVLEPLRAGILAQADAAKVTDAAGVHALLKNKLVSLAPGSDGKPAKDDIALAQKEVAKYKPTLGVTCSGRAAEMDTKDSGVDDGDACTGRTQMDVVDALIASLRAQRVQALASGNKPAADDLLAAINAAYDQRTAMIYLRPASDYLRSVHSASDLQDAAEPQYRNMLNDWLRYVDPARSDKDVDARRKLELEKLYWQNINRVTLGGGGFTNFVLAKDDVGNWYVKAYSSDPEAIFKSATKLAMFNAGSRLNVNLMQRYDLQARIDESKDPAEKDRLGQQLDKLDSQDGRPLLALRARYSQQYGSATDLSAARLHKQLNGMAAAVDKLVDDSGANKDEACSLAETKAGLAGLDKTYLDASRSQLEALVSSQGSGAAGRTAESVEKAIQSGLIALHLYSGKVYAALDESAATGCAAPWRRGVAQRARDLPRTQLLDIVRERRGSVERYEDALLNITEVATQK